MSRISCHENIIRQSNFKLFNQNIYKSNLKLLKIKKQLGYIVSSPCIILLQDIKWYTLTISERKMSCSFWYLLALVQIVLKKKMFLAVDRISNQKLNNSIHPPERLLWKCTKCTYHSQNLQQFAKSKLSCRRRRSEMRNIYPITDLWVSPLAF